MTKIILASASEIRADLLRRAGLDFDVIPGRIDEQAVRESHMAEGGAPRDLADLLAEMKGAESVRQGTPARWSSARIRSWSVRGASLVNPRPAPKVPSICGFCQTARIGFCRPQWFVRMGGRFGGTSGRCA